MIDKQLSLSPTDRSARPLRVLISCAGRRVELLKLFQNAARRIGCPIEIVVSDAASENMVSAAAFADDFVQVPPLNDPSYGTRVLEIVKQKKIDLIIPTIDPDLDILVNLAPTLLQQGCIVGISGPETIAICRDKALTMLTLANGGVPVPLTCKGADFDPEDPAWIYPLICKPRRGSSSIGLREFETPHAARSGPPQSDDIVQQKFFGREYTINIFVEGGEMMYSIPHLRIATRDGEMNKGVTVRMPRLQEISQKLIRALPDAWGPLCFQVMLDDSLNGGVFEINGRFGGGYPLANHAGADGPERLLRHVTGLPSEAPVVDWTDGMIMLRYDESVFIAP